MIQKTKEQHQIPAQTYPSGLEEIKKQKKNVEEQEIAGRHKNDGQKDHKGAR